MATQLPRRTPDEEWSRRERSELSTGARHDSERTASRTSSEQAARRSCSRPREDLRPLNRTDEERHHRHLPLHDKPSANRLTYWRPPCPSLSPARKFAQRTQSASPRPRAPRIRQDETASPDSRASAQTCQSERRTARCLVRKGCQKLARLRLLTLAQQLSARLYQLSPRAG